MTNDYKPGQILYIQREYGSFYISVLRCVTPAKHNAYEIHTVCDLTVDEYNGEMYPSSVTFKRGDGSLLDFDTSFAMVREATNEERIQLFNALVKAFKDYDLGWANHFTDSSYFDILDWLAWEFDVDLDDETVQKTPLGETISEIQNYIWDALCKETGNYQACTDYVEPEMVNKQEFIAKVRNWLEKHTYDDKYWTSEGDDLYLGNLIDELIKYLEE